ncbi:hypothetical protein MSAN_01517300 [Mycena sanguinolenta]|uniref:Uncharacterized protein n=1 Tax=Mycena sanguinolenta TaxID=230812 RepID=A0A8H7CZN0_9AGAR|nr:hypothetical protein MSAN_01517300 [Mycena sanguinolenta]
MDLNNDSEREAIAASTSDAESTPYPGILVNNYYITGGFGGSGGEGLNQGGDGDAAEEAWNQHLAKYEAVRHPNIMQLYGLVSTRGIYAMVFHDELIPYAQFLRRFEHLPILTTYIMAYCTTEFQEATNYISGVFRESPIDYDNSPVWIRPLTGESVSISPRFNILDHDHACDL